MEKYKEFKQINGIQLKEIEFFPAREGVGYQFDFYFNGKKAGHFVDWGDGSIVPNVTFEKHPLDTADKRQLFLNLVKTSIPDYYYDLQTKKYGDDEYFEKNKLRTQGKIDDLAEFLFYCEAVYKFEHQKTK